MDKNEALNKLEQRVTDGGDGTPKKPIIDAGQYVKVSVGDLRLAAISNPTHPTAAIYLTSVEDFDDDSREVVVDRIDLLSLLQNRVTYPNFSPTAAHRSKVLGEERNTGAPVEGSLLDVFDHDPKDDGNQ